MSRPKKLSGLTMSELEVATGVTRRAIYHWTRAGLLPSPTSSGRGVRYDDAYVARVRTIRRLRKENVPLSIIAERLDRPEKKPEPAPAAPPAAPTVALASEHWEHIVLVPGLELSFRSDGGPLLRRLAAEIWKQFGTRAA